MVAPGLATTTNRPPAALRYEAPAQHHPLLLPMYEACQEILTFASELVFLQLPSAAEVFGSVQAMLDRFHQTATAASIPREDAMEAAYALAALLDESLVHVPQWRGADEWHRWPLQVRLFNDRNAGENFFARMTALEQQPHRVHVLQVYYLCLLLGFQGRYRLGRNDGIFPVLEQAATRLRGFIPAGEVMSPHGEVPDKPPPFLQREKLIVRACLGAFVLAVAVFFGMKGLLAWHARSTLEPLRNYAAEGEREAARSIAKP
jgi:type VI secretion system protein ImpK